MKPLALGQVVRLSNAANPPKLAQITLASPVNLGLQSLMLEFANITAIRCDPQGVRGGMAITVNWWLIVDYHRETVEDLLGIPWEIDVQEDSLETAYGT